jgi:hypothetical protein
MSEPSAHRTLVKSPPELWAEVSDVEALARHLGEFGEVRITRVQPETTVAWEGDRARGTVALEPAGWGTKVTITAQVEAEPEPVSTPPPPEPDPERVAERPTAERDPEPEPVAQEPRRGWLARLFRRRVRTMPPEPTPPTAGPEPVAEAEPEPVAHEPEPEPQPAGFDDDRVLAILTGVLDDLGSAHHRPFSRG